MSGNFLADVIATSEPHRDSLTALLKGRRGLPSWVRNMVSQPRYVALASERFDIAGQAMQRFRACQPGRCEASRIWVLYSADGKRAVARVVDEGLGETLFGDPSVAELAALRR
nr:Ivy family c-type lysozyme inhibitor [Rhizobium sp. CG5]